MARTDLRTTDRERWDDGAATEAAVADARALGTTDAARLLHVSGATLRAWELEFGFPARLVPAGPYPLYPVAQLLALRSALGTSASIAAAMRTARERLAPTS